MKRAFFILILIIFFLTASNSVFAIGIYPSSRHINFTPNLDASGTFTVNNNENNTIYIELTKRGELVEYVSLFEDKYKLEPEERKEFTYILQLPSELKPGKHILRLGAVQVAEESEGLAAAAGVETLLAVSVPYPPKYLITAISMSSDTITNMRNLNISVSSLGDEDVYAEGELVILDYFGEIVYSKDFEGITYYSKSNVVLEENIPTGDIVDGLYTANVKFEYSGEEATDEKEFSIGEPEITIISIEKHFMKQGEIGKIITEIYNNYKGDISDVVAKLYIRDKIIGTDPIVLGALENATIETEIDTKYFDYGTYKSLLKISYDKGKIIEKEVELFIFPKNIEILIMAVIIFISIIAFIALRHIRGRKK